MATEEAVTPPAKEVEIREATFSYITSDTKSLKDEHNKPKRRSLIRLSSCETDWTFLNCKNKTKFMSINPHGISKITEPGKKYLCLEYGPEETRPMFVLIDFTDEPSESFEEWNELSHKMMGLEYIDDKRSRSKTENNHTMQKPKSVARRKEVTSAFQPSIRPIVETSPSNGPTTPDDVFESPVPPLLDHLDVRPAVSGFEHPTHGFPMSGSLSPGGASPGSDTGSDISQFTSLKSNCSYSPQPEEIKCTKDNLSQHLFKDYKGDIIVTNTIPGSKLDVGDIIDFRNADIPMNARGLTEHIRTMAEQTIPLTVKRGAEITVNAYEQGNVMNIRGPKGRRPDIVDVIMKTCHSSTNGESKFVIAEINDKPVEAGTQTDQVEQRLRDALMQSPEGLRLRPIPQSLLRTNDELLDDVDDVQVSAPEARPIDVEGVPNVSRNTQSTDETEC